MATQRAVCLLRSRRRTFLFLVTSSQKPILCLLRNPRLSYLSFLCSALHKSHEIAGSLIMYENVTLIIVL